MRYIIGVDTGGTFTDVTVMTPQGELFMDKAPTTPRDFSIGDHGCVDGSKQTDGAFTERAFRKYTHVQAWEHGFNQCFDYERGF